MVCRKRVGFDVKKSVSEKKVLFHYTRNLRCTVGVLCKKRVKLIFLTYTLEEEYFHSVRSVRLSGRTSSVDPKTIFF